MSLKRISQEVPLQHTYTLFFSRWVRFERGKREQVSEREGVKIHLFSFSLAFVSKWPFIFQIGLPFDNRKSLIIVWVWVFGVILKDRTFGVSKSENENMWESWRNIRNEKCERVRSKKRTKRKSSNVGTCAQKKRTRKSQRTNRYQEWDWERMKKKNTFKSKHEGTHLKLYNIFFLHSAAARLLFRSFFLSVHEKWQSERAIATKSHIHSTHRFAESHNDICIIYNKIIRALFLSLFFSFSSLYFCFVLSCCCAFFPTCIFRLEWNMARG